MDNGAGAAVAREWRHPRGKRPGSFSRKQALKSLDEGGGLRGKELVLWYSRIEALWAARGHARPVPAHIAEFRSLLDSRSDRQYLPEGDVDI